MCKQINWYHKLISLYYKILLATELSVTPWWERSRDRDRLPRGGQSGKRRTVGTILSKCAGAVSPYVIGHKRLGGKTRKGWRIKMLGWGQWMWWLLLIGPTQRLSPWDCRRNIISEEGRNEFYMTELGKINTEGSTGICQEGEMRRWGWGNDFSNIVMLTFSDYLLGASICVSMSTYSL